MMMPAKRVFLTADQVDALKPGDESNIDSGMGGSFTVQVTDVNEFTTMVTLVSKTPGWPGTWTMSKLTCSMRLFSLVPDYNSPY